MNFQEFKYYQVRKFSCVLFKGNEQSKNGLSDYERIFARRQKPHAGIVRENFLLGKKSKKTKQQPSPSSAMPSELWQKG